MDAFLLFVESWWWIAPVVAGVGAAGYRAVTTNRRRARRLELDAALYEERLAFRALLVARADSRAAKGDVLAVKARRDAPASVLAEARRRSAAAKDREWSASLNLRAARTRISAARVQYRTRVPDAPLPIDVLVARQDAVTARWLSYETDPAKALSFPQMLDPQHPTTLAFLRAQRDAQELRPNAARERVTPTVYLAYRDAVVAAEVAFEAAEGDALGLARESVSGLSWGSVPISLPSWLPRAADVLRTVTDTLGTVVDPTPPHTTDQPAGTRPPWPVPAWRSAPPPRR
ncbi:hypothetical protein [Microbacterium deminutum]|uniref:Secreted protein n=1 Tax=Microbacterium deminutum TaxID=344164 RepID=A0ABN2QPH9_9MICO